MTDPRTPAERSDSEAVFHFRPNEVPIKALEWESIDNTSEWAACKPLWLCYRITLRADRTKTLRLEWLGNRNDELGTFIAWDGAKAAAQADFEFRIRCAIRQPTETELLQLAARIYGLPEHRPEAPADRRQNKDTAP